MDCRGAQNPDGPEPVPARTATRMGGTVPGRPPRIDTRDGGPRRPCPPRTTASKPSTATSRDGCGEPTASTRRRIRTSYNRERSTNGTAPATLPAAGSDRNKPETATSGSRSTRSPKNGLTKTATDPAPHHMRDPAGSRTEDRTEGPNRGPGHQGKSTRRRQDEGRNSWRRTTTTGQASSRTALAETTEFQERVSEKRGNSRGGDDRNRRSGTIVGSADHYRTARPKTATREERAAERQGQLVGSGRRNQRPTDRHSSS